MIGSNDAVACDAGEVQMARAQNGESEVIAIFDFDKTLVSIDTGAAFINWMIRRNKLRTALATLALPLAGPLFLVPKTRLMGISVFLWIGTVGYNRGGFHELCSEFGKAFGEAHGSGRAFALVVDALREHVRAGHRVVIISGSMDALVQRIVRRLVDGEVEVIGSSVREFGRGLIGHRHCFGEAKVKMALDRGLPNRTWDVGYSDSAADIHIMRCCKRRVLVNPSPKTIAAYRKVLGDDFEVLRCD